MKKLILVLLALVVISFGFGKLEAISTGYLNELLKKETTDRQTADKAIGVATGTIKADLTTETSARQNADATLTTNLAVSTTGVAAMKPTTKDALGTQMSGYSLFSSTQAVSLGAASETWVVLSGLSFIANVEYSLSQSSAVVSVYSISTSSVSFYNWSDFDGQIFWKILAK